MQKTIKKNLKKLAKRFQGTKKILYFMFTNAKIYTLNLRNHKQNS